MKLENLNDSKFQNFAENEITDLSQIKGGNREETGANTRLLDGGVAVCLGDVKIDGVIVLSTGC